MVTTFVKVGAVVLGVAAIWVAILPPAPAAQPLAFNHARHAALACAVCHRGAEAGVRAGLPDGSVCVKCHATPPRAVPEVVWQGLTRKGPAPWVNVNRLPDHVLFSHRRHVGGGRLQCVSCHGNIGSRTTPPGVNPVRLEMDTCLSCHRREHASEDCAGCHR
jgi:hypothetical protein